jgi:uncharacterized SAM-binding protein YcdF (DUF218 family)
VWAGSARPYPGGVSSTAVVVLGNQSRRTCRLLVAEAERTARRVNAGVVVFSGWSSGDGPAEAKLMRDLWRGPANIETVVEDTSSTTVENAVRTLPLLLDRGVTEAVVVCAPLHLARARWLFRRVYERHAVTVRLRAARVAPTPGALVWELAALTVAARQLRAAGAELERR